MKLEYPLNEALPNTDSARDRLLAKIFRYRKEETQDAGYGDENFELLYAYGMYLLLESSRNACHNTNTNPALVTGQLSKEITEVGKEIEQLFGVLDEEMLRLQ